MTGLPCDIGYWFEFLVPARLQTKELGYHQGPSEGELSLKETPFLPSLSYWAAERICDSIDAYF